MTVEDLAAEMYAKQGYFAMPHFESLEIGDLYMGVTLEGRLLTTPFRVVGIATRQQLKAQRALQVEIWPNNDCADPWHPGKYIYLLEAAD